MNEFLWIVPRPPISEFVVSVVCDANFMAGDVKRGALLIIDTRGWRPN